MKNFYFLFVIVFIIALTGVLVFFIVKENNLSGKATSEKDASEQNIEISINVQSNQELFVGESKQLYLTVSPENAIVTLSFNENVISINDNYKILGLSKGQTDCVITAMINENIKQKTVKITVNEENEEPKEDPNEDPKEDPKETTFIEEFYEDFVFDKSNRTINLYSNISNQELAELSKHSKQATFVQDLKEFDLVVENEDIAKFEGNKIVALTDGETTLNVRSKNDTSFYKKFDIVVKVLEITDFDVYIDDVLFDLNQTLVLQTSDSICMEIKNFLPNYISFEKEFSTENSNISFDEKTNLIVAEKIGESGLIIEVGNCKKIVNFEIEKPSNNDEEEKLSLILQDTNDINVAINQNQEEDIEEVTINSKVAIFQMEMMQDEKLISLEELKIEIISNENIANTCNLEGKMLVISFSGNINENIKVKFSYTFESKTYEFYVSFIYLI